MSLLPFLSQLISKSLELSPTADFAPLASYQEALQQELTKQGLKLGSQQNQALITYAYALLPLRVFVELLQKDLKSLIQPSSRSLVEAVQDLPLYSSIKHSQKSKSKSKLQLFLVGGFVRNPFFGLESSDVDLALEGTSLAQIQAIADSGEFPADFSAEDKEIMQFVLDSKQMHPHAPVFKHPLGIEIALCRQEFGSERQGNKADFKDQGVSIYTDLLRRDLAINALPLPISLTEVKAIIATSSPSTVSTIPSNSDSSSSSDLTFVSNKIATNEAEAKELDSQKSQGELLLETVSKFYLSLRETLLTLSVLPELITNPQHHPLYASLSYYLGAINPPAFKNDPLRLLKAGKFYSQLSTSNQLLDYLVTTSTSNSNSTQFLASSQDYEVESPDYQAVAGVRLTDLEAMSYQELSPANQEALLASRPQSQELLKTIFNISKDTVANHNCERSLLFLEKVGFISPKNPTYKEEVTKYLTKFLAYQESLNLLDSEASELNSSIQQQGSSLRSCLGLGPLYFTPANIEQFQLLDKSAVLTASQLSSFLLYPGQDLELLEELKAQPALLAATSYLDIELNLTNLQSCQEELLASTLPWLIIFNQDSTSLDQSSRLEQLLTNNLSKTEKQHLNFLRKSRDLLLTLLELEEIQYNSEPNTSEENNLKLNNSKSNTPESNNPDSKLNSELVTKALGLLTDFDLFKVTFSNLKLTHPLLKLSLLLTNPLFIEVLVPEVSNYPQVIRRSKESKDNKDKDSEDYQNSIDSKYSIDSSKYKIDISKSNIDRKNRTGNITSSFLITKLCNLLSTTMSLRLLLKGDKDSKKLLELNTRNFLQ